MEFPYFLLICLLQHSLWRTIQQWMKQQLVGNDGNIDKLLVYIWMSIYFCFWIVCGWFARIASIMRRIRLLWDWRMFPSFIWVSFRFICFWLSFWYVVGFCGAGDWFLSSTLNSLYFRSCHQIISSTEARKSYGILMLLVFISMVEGAGMLVGWKEWLSLIQ